ncbi:chromatin remodeling protein EBS-like [Rutidosis leptorrhynchoides]|uniref:chromatin remodeling protein EBS-like n=1 Tax=Rutidosis leptorrhynchoides TaxID=125765 RepID=UPI003A99C368
MAKTRPGKRDLETYTIKGTNKEQLSVSSETLMQLRVRNFLYCFEFGDYVLMRSSENEKAPYVARVETIEADVKGNVKNYTKLDDVGPEDYFCRFEYKAATREFTPDRVDV